MSKSNIKFAIVGCGRIAARHAEHILTYGRLTAVCDVVAEKATLFAAQFQSKAYFTIESLLQHESPDVVSICSPNGLHARHTIAALQAGCHVLCEKPMAISVQDCHAMIREAEKMNRRLFVVKQNRFNPPVMALKQLVEEGRLGRLLSVQVNCFWNRNDTYYADNWRGTKNMDGGTLFTQFSHFIDLLHWLLGDVKKVAAFTKNSNHRNSIEFEDQGVVIMEFDNGVQGGLHYTVNSYGKNMEGSITLLGEKGTVKVGGQYLNELEYQQIEGFSIDDLLPGNPPNNYGHYQGSMSNHHLVYENVVQAITKNQMMVTSGLDGLKTVEIIEQIYNAAR